MGDVKYLVGTIIVLGLILLVGYVVIDETPVSVLKTDTKASTTLQRFEVEQNPTGFSVLAGMMRETKDARKRNLRYDEIDEEVDRCIEKITKNWKRTYYHKSYEGEYDEDKEEWIMTNSFDEREKEFYGYDGEEDSNLRWKIRNRAIDGKKAC
ncbi:MAG: hypothetical protein KKC75_03710 [Nanoarchaeota archaeon]|nr:hypothetical protein [Nanoarchaeota archaeon]MBU1005795.1 hypothetical protein [Nanoarchaeota archaeon]MBU1946573.1 hypothetical protein [Nanoarchaeota archaeon]